MKVLRQTTLTMNEDDYKIKDKLKDKGFGNIAIWREGARVLLKKIDKEKKNK